MPRVLDARLDVRLLQSVLALEGLAVGARDFRATPHEDVRLLQLREADGRVNIRQVVLEAGVVDFVKPRAALVVTLPRVLVHAVQARNRDLFSQRIILGSDSAAFGTGEILGRVKTEAGEIADGADLGHPATFEMARRADRMRSIFDDLQIMTPRDCENAIHVAWMAGEVYRLDRLDSLVLTALQRFLDPGRTDVESAGVDVDENRVGAG